MMMNYEKSERMQNLYDLVDERGLQPVLDLMYHQIDMLGGSNDKMKTFMTNDIESLISYSNSKKCVSNLEQKIKEFSIVSVILNKYRDDIIKIAKKQETLNSDEFYNEVFLMINEMSKEEHHVLKNIYNKMNEVLEKHKKCNFKSVQKLDGEKQMCLFKTSQLMEDIKENLYNKDIAIRECDVENYDIHVEYILKKYSYMLPMFLNALVYDRRIQDCKISNA